MLNNYCAFIDYLLSSWQQFIFFINRSWRVYVMLAVAMIYSKLFNIMTLKWHIFYPFLAHSKNLKSTLKSLSCLRQWFFFLLIVFFRWCCSCSLCCISSCLHFKAVFQSSEFFVCKFDAIKGVL